MQPMSVKQTCTLKKQMTANLQVKSECNDFIDVAFILDPYITAVHFRMQ